MSKCQVNITQIHYCAFCKYWYDPTNSTIEPKNGAGHLWLFDTDRKEQCMKRFATKKRSWDTCKMFECKIPY